MPECREVARAVSSESLEHAPWHRRFACWLHLMMCSHCREYRDQIEALGSSLREEVGEPDPGALARIESEILRELE